MTPEPSAATEPTHSGASGPSWGALRAVRAGALTFDVAVAGPEDGEPVMLLHGFPESCDQWALVAPMLAEAGCRVLAPNLRGYSREARPQGVEHYRIGRLVDDVVALIDALGHGSVHLVAHDWGGTVGWFTAVRHPERVRTLTAVSTAHPRAIVEAASADEDQRAAMGYIKQLRRSDAEERLRADDWRLLRTMCRDLPRAAFDVHARLLAEPGALTGAVNYYRAHDPHEGAALGPCLVPTTYVWGADDFAFLETAARATTRHVDAPYTFVELDGVGHWISDLEPQALATAVLERIGAASGDE